MLYCNSCMSVETRQNRFPSTHWSQVRLAARTGDVQARCKFLDELLRRYSPPLKAHLAARYQLAPEHTDDLFQAFLEQRIVMKELLSKADRARGRLRTFLLNALDNFVLNELRNERAKKRNPAGGRVSLSELPEASEPSVAAPNHASLDAAWARAVMAEAVRRARDECAREGRHAVWGVLEGRILRPALADEPPRSYDELAAMLGFDEPAQVYKALVTAKNLFHRVLRSVIAEYAADEKDVERELDDWKAIFAQAGVDRVRQGG